MINLTRIQAAVFLLAIPFIFFGSTIPVFASQSDIKIEINVPHTPPPPPPPIDMCPNIPGIQTSIPEGMQIDSEGNCYTPIPPEDIDLCLNLPGIQAYIPSGHYRTADGNCYPQPTPPVDVCPNLPGVHLSVPDGYFLDPETNTCISVTDPPVPPTSGDVCLNIPGIQYVTPPGMINIDGYCFTPDTTEPEPPLKNVPDFLQPFARFLVGLIPEPMRDYFRNLPEGVVNQLPLYTFILVFIFILVPILQSIREYLYQRRLLAFYKREQSIAEEKNNFITLASHYIRTPIAIMRDTVPLMQNAADITPQSAVTITGTLEALGNQVSASLEAANANPALQNLADPAIVKPKPFWRSSFFWIPIILSAILTLLANFLIGVVGDKEIGMSNAYFQLFIVAVFIVVLYLIVRNYHIQKKLRQEKDILIAREQTIDSVRNEFLDQQAANISTALSTLYFTSPTSPPSQPYILYTDGLSRLSNLHNKFMLLAQIKTGANRNASTFNLKSTIDNAITYHNADIKTKNLTVQNTVGDTMIVQNEPLFSFVISSVLDNAVKFTDPGGHILFSSQPKSKTILVRISDNGHGIDPTKLDQLFKPFSRAESAVNFSYEGLGLSLFANRLILAYTGGSISAAPRPTGGTDVTVCTPININDELVVPIGNQPDSADTYSDRISNLTEHK